ncbi:MAG TPA: hypothetical protein VMD76_07955 [Candidatus Sulfotelmatobacter sp.]|nr:hypothetical protein [Candidatus Sulfotelmatobacter sp.]
MKFEKTIRLATVLVLSSSLAFASAGGSDKNDKKDKANAKQTIDSGSFGVFVNGQRLATETFTVQQESGVSVIKSQVKETAAADPATQNSNLEINSSGDLLRYEWNQSSGGSLSVLPSNDFLLERITAAGSAKPAEKPFLMPSTSSILDNNFFVHREVLLWRYLAATCKPEGGNLKCQQGPTTFGVLVPQDQTSMSIRLEVVGREKVTIRGAERELLRLNLTGENSEWALWVDDHDQFKLMRVSIPADHTEVVRD